MTLYTFLNMKQNKDHISDKSDRTNVSKLKA